MSFFKKEIITKTQIDDLLIIISDIINKETKVLVNNKVTNENGFSIEGKTKTQWLKNAWPTQLSVSCVKSTDDLAKIEISVRSKMESFTQEKTNKELIDLIVVNLRKAIVIEMDDDEKNIGLIHENKKPENISSDSMELKKLKMLYDEGILTEEEFLSKKKKIIGD
jgi:hypothetical protein